VTGNLCLDFTSEKPEMKLRVSIVGILIMVLNTGFVYGSLIMDMGSHQPPANCHEHGSKPIPVAPVDFRCCQAGHDAQILLPSWTVQPALHAAEPLTADLSLSARGLEGFQHPIRTSADPPGLTPLRI